MSDDDQDLAAAVARRREEREAEEAMQRPAVERLTHSPAFLRAMEQVRADPSRADALIRAIDLETRREVDEGRRRSRWAEFVSTRPEEFVDSSYERLHPQQNPDRKVTRWWASGRRTLLLAGPPRKGKSDAGYAICNEIAAADLRRGPGEREVVVRGWPMLDLFAALDWPDAHERRDEAWSRERDRLLQQAKTCDLLLLDDPGKEAKGDLRREILFAILDTRVHSAGRCRTIVTMNVEDPEGLGESARGKLLTDTVTNKYGAAVYGRLKQDAVAAWIDGEDLTGWATLDETDPFEETL